MKQIIAGVDEVGRGSWAGPLVAVAAILNKKIDTQLLQDSKTITPRRRLEIFHKIKDSCCWALWAIPASDIDLIGLQAANMMALKFALYNLPVIPDYAIFDGICAPKKINIPHITEPKADSKYDCVSAASILAKVIRDKTMESLLPKHYCFEKHKGYGTALHRKTLQTYGVSKWHRKCFSPVAKYII